MPLFFFISGYLFSHLVIDRGKYESFSGFIKNKVQRLLIPCVVFIGVMSLTLQENFIDKLFFYGFHLWFLKVLFVCFIVCWFSNKYITNPKNEVLVWILTVLLMAAPMIQFWSLGQFFKKYVFFYTGYLIYKYRKNFSFLYNKKGLIISSVVFGMLVLTGLFLYGNYSWNDDFDFREPLPIKAIEILIMGFATIALVFSAVNVYLNNHPNFKLGILATINNLSYGIYLLHVYLLQTMYKYLNDILGPLFNAHYIVAPIILFVLVIVLSIIVTKLVKKIKYGSYIVG